MFDTIKISAMLLLRALLGPSPRDILARYAAAAALVTPELSDADLLAMSETDWACHSILRDQEQDNLSAAVGARDYNSAFVTINLNYARAHSEAALLSRMVRRRHLNEWYRYRRLQSGVSAEQTKTVTISQ